jgi:hypothetical protein
MLTEIDFIFINFHAFKRIDDKQSVAVNMDFIQKNIQLGGSNNLP